MRTRAITDLNAVRAAWLVGECGYTQERVAEELGLSQSTVSRLITRARDGLECLEDVPRFVRSNVPRGLLDQIDDERRREDLLARLGTLARAGAFRLRHLQFVDSGGTDFSEEGIDRRQRYFGLQAAPHVAERLRQARTIGVAWGSTVSRVIDGLARVWSPAALVNPRIVPVSAEPMRFAHNEFTSSTLARRLDGIINGEEDAESRRLALTGVPAFIPANFRRLLPQADRWSDQEHADFRAAFDAFFKRSSPAYHKIFGDPFGEIFKVDALLTSAGSSDKPMGFCNEDLLEAGGLTREALAELVVGDVGGVLVARSPDEPLPPSMASDAAALIGRTTDRPTKQDLVDALNTLWTGIKRSHLARIAERAHLDKTPGVLLVALGERRRHIVCEAVAEGLCTELIIDRDLAGALPAAIAERARRSSPIAARTDAAAAAPAAPARRRARSSRTRRQRR